MERMEFLVYLNKLEQAVIVPGLQKKLFGTVQTVPVKSIVDDYSPLSKVIGSRFIYDKPAVIRYYDTRKRSTGFMKAAVEQNMGFAVTWATMVVPVVNFDQIKKWHVQQLEPILLHGWTKFKAALEKSYVESKT
jgi:hypothetical protein